MNTLISMVNSGESLEKMTALVETAYESNPDFYYSYDKVIVFYSDNIIKRKNDINIHGLIKSLVNNDISKKLLNIDKIDEIVKYKKQILDILHKENKISIRQFDKLMQDENLFINLVSSMPWDNIFQSKKEKIIKYLENKYINLKILKINDLYNCDELISLQPFYQSFGKLYFYDYNGSTITKKISKSSESSELDFVKSNSIYYTFNVFVLLIAAYNYAKNNNICFGYRPMRSSPRDSYNKAIEYINIEYKNTIIEPRNYKFNKYLSNYSYSMPINERSCLVIYDLFSKIIDKIL